MGMRIPPLNIKILLDSNPLRSRILVQRLALPSVPDPRAHDPVPRPAPYPRKGHGIAIACHRPPKMARSCVFCLPSCAGLAAHSCGWSGAGLTSSLPPSRTDRIWYSELRIASRKFSFCHMASKYVRIPIPCGAQFLYS